MGDATQRFIDALEAQGLQGRQVGQGRWRYQCPAHEDRVPALSVRYGEGGNVWVRCFVGCPIESIVDALGLRMGDLFDDPMSPTSQGKPRPKKPTPPPDD